MDTDELEFCSDGSLSQRIDAAIQTSFESELADIFRDCSPNRYVVIHESMIAMFNLLNGSSTLKRLNVRNIYLMQNSPPKIEDPDGQYVTILGFSSNKLIYICRSDVQSFELISKHIQLLAKQPYYRFNAKVVTVPQIEYQCEAILEENGVYGLSTVSALPLYFAGIDEDVFSMNASVASNDFCVFGDTTLIPQIVHAICRLASAVNISWTEITCAGRGAVDVYRLMSELGYVLPKSPSNLLSTDPSPCSLILFDRRVDLMSALLSQLTYAGMAMETCQVSCGVLQLPATLVSQASLSPDSKVGQPTSQQQQQQHSKPEKERTVKLKLSTKQDEVYAKLRDLNFSSVHEVLQRMSSHISTAIDARKTEDLQELAAFVKKLPKLKGMSTQFTHHMMLALHINQRRSGHIVTDILEAELAMFMSSHTRDAIDLIQVLICQEHPINTILRLLLLLRISTVVAEKTWKELCEMVLHGYGYQYSAALAHLELVAEDSAISPTTLHVLRRKFPLPVPEEDAPRQVFFGINPISTFVISQLAVAKCDQDLNTLRKAYENDELFSFHSVATKGLVHLPPHHIVIVFLGGVTQAELTSLRCELGKHNLSPIFLTTDMITGDSLASALHTIT